MVNRISTRKLIIAAALVAAVATGCGGGGAGGGGIPGGGGGGGTAGATLDQRFALMDAVKQKSDSLVGLTNSAYNQQMLAFLKSQAVVKSASIQGNNVAATLTDDFPICIADNQIPDPTAGSKGMALATRPSTRSEVPYGGTVQTFNALDGVAGFPDPTVGVRSWATKNGYQANAATMTLDNLRRLVVATDGVVVLNGHGGIGDDGVFMLSSVDRSDKNRYNPNSPNYDSALAQDLAALPRRVGSVFAVTGFAGPKQPIREWVDAIRPAFAQKYWKFSDNSFLYLQACHGFSSDFLQACFQNGLSAYGSWDNSVVASTATRAANYLFDRSLGANMVSVQATPQRAYHWRTILNHMHDLGTDHSHAIVDNTNVDAYLKITANYAKNSKYFGVMAPGLIDIHPDVMNKTLTLVGDFSAYDRPVVTLGTQALTVKSFTQGEIVCDLPPTGGGNVVVSYQNHRSNALQLTEWQGDLHYVVTNGALTLRVNIHVHLRMDANPTGPGLDQPVSPPTIFTGLAESDSTADYAATGSDSWQLNNYGDIYTSTATLTGAGPLSFTYGQVGGTSNGFSIVATLDTIKKTLQLGIAESAKQAILKTYTSKYGTTPQNFDLTSLPTITVPIDSGYNGASQTVAADVVGDLWNAVHGDPAKTVSAKLICDGLTATGAPDVSTGRSVRNTRVTAR